MRERKGIFKGYSESTCWIPLTQSVMEANNMAMLMTGGDDYNYCRIFSFCHDMLLVPYVDNAKMPLYVFNRFFYVFIYVLEFVYGNPYSNEHEINKKYVTAEEYFSNIKKHWNDDIEKKLRNKYK